MSWSDTSIPMKFESVEELQQKIDDYFLSCLSPIMETIPNPDYDLDGDKIANEDIPKYIERHKRNAKGDLMYTQHEPYTISGLAYALGTSRTTLLEYQKELKTSLDPEILKGCADAIKRAKQKIETYMEKYMFEGKNQTSAIFVAKNNFGWIDRSERDVTTKGDSLNEKTLAAKADAILE
jgi:hypothetical protein